MKELTEEVLIAKTLRSLRTFRGDTVDEVAEGLGWPKWKVYFVERADRKVTYSEVKAYAEYLGFTTDELFEYATNYVAPMLKRMRLESTSDNPWCPQTPADLQELFGAPLFRGDTPVDADIQVMESVS
jgi:transcriptional regulator with XRE-family HTH domain